ncbi:MAG: M3 family metallopeptidase [Reichenbachiella sp.]
MKNSILILVFVAMLITGQSCQNNSHSDSINNLLLKEWEGKYGGVPAFDKMDVALLTPAMKQAMAMNIQEIEAIAENPEKPTFENTNLAFDNAGQELSRVNTYYSIYRRNLSSEEFRAVAKVLEPLRSEHSSRIVQNEKLFLRIKSVYEESLINPFPADQQRMVQMDYEYFTMRGAELNSEKKKRYAEIDKELSGLYINFSNNVLHDEEEYVTYLNENQLKGLSESYIKSAALVAQENGKDGMYGIKNTRSSMAPFLTYSEERALREKVWKNYYARGDNGDEFDNNEIIVKILKLRRERVQLLGFDNYGEWRLSNRMAKNPQNALNLLEAVWPAAIARVSEEVSDMQALADKEGASISIAPWDYRYYAEKVRLEKYALDGDEVKKYLQLDKLREAMFFVAGELFNFKFTAIAKGKVPVFHEDVKVWEVTDKSSGRLIGLWYLDPYARKGKRSGAWANSYRSHSSYDREVTVLSSNNSNFIKGAPGEPVLVSWDDANTFFHEMGHALHALSSNVRYTGLNYGVRDYTEFHSQLLERWLSTDEVINNYLLHSETGQPMPAELVSKIKKAANFNQGFSTTEYLASAIMDMKFHLADPKDLNVDSFEREELAKIGMPTELVMRHRSPQFNHVFSSEGYATGYYGYMWADVLTADAAEAFSESPNGFYDKALAKKMVETLFAPRNSMDPAEAYRKFRGRDAEVSALMRDRGFPVK